MSKRMAMTVLLVAILVATGGYETLAQPQQNWYTSLGGLQQGQRQGSLFQVKVVIGPA